MDDLNRHAVAADPGKFFRLRWVCARPTFYQQVRVFIHSLGKILPSHVAYYQLDVFKRLT
ncbi:MAG: hypothetical protein IMX04_03150 [Candidatus Carbobacillus altaicus]|nr:hypothetical protein [Candidatus Carbobacillus altaicus]